VAPVFAMVENWHEHLIKLRAFWSSVVHVCPVSWSADAGPLPVDDGARALDPWPALFEQTTADACPPDADDAAAGAKGAPMNRRLDNRKNTPITGRHVLPKGQAPVFPPGLGPPLGGAGMIHNRPQRLSAAPDRLRPLACALQRNKNAERIHRRRRSAAVPSDRRLPWRLPGLGVLGNRTDARTSETKGASACRADATRARGLIWSMSGRDLLHIRSANCLLICFCWGFKGHTRRRDAIFRARRRIFL
jgi:hypothetical protein